MQPPLAVLLPFKFKVALVTEQAAHTAIGEMQLHATS